MGKFRQIFTELSAPDTPIFSFPDDNLLYALTLRRSGLELLMVKFRQFCTELSAQDTPVFSFSDDNLSK